MQGDYDGWIKSGKREYDRNDSVINNYRAGEVTAMATHDESSVLDLPKSLTKQEVYTLEN